MIEAKHWEITGLDRSLWLEAVDDLMWTACGMRVQRQIREGQPPIEVNVWQAGPFMMQTGRTDASLIVSRTRESLHKTTDDHYWLYQPMGPITAHVFPSRTIDARPGELLLGTADTTFQADGSQGFDNRVVFIPRPMLDCFLRRPDFHDAISIDAKSSALVISCLDALWPMLPHLDEATVAANLHAVMALLAVAIGASSDGTEAGRQAYRSALLARAQRFIEAHAADPALTPGKVATELKVSTRQLHRMFEPTGQTAAERIAGTRLASAAERLADPDFLDVKIADVAFRSGFDSLATFHRLFKAAYGCAPGEFRERGGRVRGSGR